MEKYLRSLCRYTNALYCFFYRLSQLIICLLLHVYMQLEKRMIQITTLKDLQPSPSYLYFSCFFTVLLPPNPSLTTPVSCFPTFFK